MADDFGGGKGGGGGGGGFGGAGLSGSIFSNAGGAVTDLFNAQGLAYKAKGAEFEKQNYLLAGDLAAKNAQYTETSTAIKEMQQERETQLKLGGQQADVAASGFEESGSALDLLRDSASQGALAKAVLGQQGLITEEGYKEQEQSYKNMASAAQVAIDAAHTGEIGSYIGAGIKAVTAIAQIAAA